MIKGYVLMLLPIAILFMISVITVIPIQILLCIKAKSNVVRSIPIIFYLMQTYLFVASRIVYSLFIKEGVEFCIIICKIGFVFNTFIMIVCAVTFVITMLIADRKGKNIFDDQD